MAAKSIGSFRPTDSISTIRLEAGLVRLPKWRTSPPTKRVSAMRDPMRDFGTGNRGRRENTKILSGGFNDEP